MIFGDDRLPPRFWSKVRVAESGCWEWTGALTHNGYGILGKFRGRTYRAHRLSHESLVGTIPPGLQIDHLCKNKRCVNPAHLEPVTPRENSVVRGSGVGACNARKLYCPSGHSYSTVNNRGERVCYQCPRDRRANKRAA